MLSRWLPRTRSLRSVTRISSPKSLHSTPPLPSKPTPSFILQSLRSFSSNGNNNGDGSNFTKDPPLSSSWKLSDQEDDSIFKDTGADENGGFDDKPTQASVGGSDVNVDSWGSDPSASGDIFANIDKEIESEKSGGGDEEWETALGYKAWTFEEDGKTDVFDIGEGIEGLPAIHDEIAERGKSEADQQLEEEKRELSVQLKDARRRKKRDRTSQGGNIKKASILALKWFSKKEGLHGIQKPTHPLDTGW